MEYVGRYQLDAVTQRKNEEIIGNDPAIRKVLQDIDKIAPFEAPVIITGESGTGKELAARIIHQRSKRSKGPFIAVNCGALPANLIQSELFGYRRGAFTGASQDKIGRIEAANQGTILLDEIGDLPLEQQVNLLRFLQEGTIDPVGTRESIPVNVRVIAATHVDLQAAVRKGRLREDLYYRLTVLHLTMPPLRERPADIEPLANYFLSKFAKEKGGRARAFSKPALQIMNGYSWPGNVRELINRVRRAVIMSDTPLITPADLGLDRRTGEREIKTLIQIRAEAERLAIRKSLGMSRNNVSEAARNLGISRIYLYRLMQKHGLMAKEGTELSLN
ncbi:MAG: sigma-54 dependent transcriptional regulator [Desulfobacteraceae bacterium]|nr:sigma-54 dependent transcriptional regulator [Desulfobacteraceae bacterium]